MRPRPEARLLVALLLLVAPGAARGGGVVRPSPTPVAAEAPAFALRSPKEGKPGAALTRKEAKRLDEAMAAVRAHDLPKAEKLLRSGSAAKSIPYETAGAYVAILKGGWDEARRALVRLEKNDPSYVPALEALADLDFAEEHAREALEGYRAVLRLVPGDPHAKERSRTLLSGLVARRRVEAEAALERKDLDGARRIAVSLMELDPTSPAGPEVLSLLAEARGHFEDAYGSAVKARALDPDSPKRTERVAELAMKTRRFGDAAALYDRLAAKDPAYRERAQLAHVEWQIQSLPEVARRAASSQKLTRAQAAALVYSLVPEVREGPTATPPEVAVDAVGRAERPALVRAIALGLFSVSRETHRVGADTAVSRQEMAGLLQRVAAVVAMGRRLPPCLEGEPSLPALRECGILPDSTSRTVAGREAFMSIEGAARQARQGGTR